MKVKPIFVLIAFCLCFTGCARTEQIPHQDIPAWDESIPLEDSNSERPSLFKRLLSDDNSNYHFRKVRWGFSRERVEFSEAGNTVFERKDNAVVYNCKVNGVYCKLIYTFKDIVKPENM